MRTTSHHSFWVVLSPNFGRNTGDAPTLHVIHTQQRGPNENTEPYLCGIFVPNTEGADGFPWAGKWTSQLACLAVSQQRMRNVLTPRNTPEWFPGKSPSGSFPTRTRSFQLNTSKLFAGGPNERADKGVEDFSPNVIE